MAITDLLTLLPKSVALSVASIVIGAAAFAGMETRYVTAGAFQKSYVLQLKREIRELRRELRSETDPERRADLEDDIAALIDVLCLEVPADRECAGG